MASPTGREIIKVTRQLVTAMKQIRGGIDSAAMHAGKLEALRDNANQVETLSSPRADMTYQLFAALYRAYNDLAEHLSNGA